MPRLPLFLASALAGAALVFGLAPGGASAQSATPTAAQTATAERFAAKCIASVRAPGRYQIVHGGRIPRVMAAGAGATQTGAANVNDCLADAYQVQPGRVVAAAPAAEPQPGDGPDYLNCAEILTRSPGAAAGYAFTTGFLFGVVGSSLQAGTYQRNLQTCLAQQGSLAASVGGGRGGTYIGGGCGAGNLMVRGARYCSY